MLHLGLSTPQSLLLCSPGSLLIKANILDWQYQIDIQGISLIKQTELLSTVEILKGWGNYIYMHAHTFY